MQPVATCRQSFARPPFSLWRHSLLSWPRPPLQTCGHRTAFNIMSLASVVRIRHMQFWSECCWQAWNTSSARVSTYIQEVAVLLSQLHQFSCSCCSATWLIAQCIKRPLRLHCINAVRSRALQPHLYSVSSDELTTSSKCVFSNRSHFTEINYFMCTRQHVPVFSHLQAYLRVQMFILPVQTAGKLTTKRNVQDRERRGRDVPLNITGATYYWGSS